MGQIRQLLAVKNETRLVSNLGHSWITQVEVFCPRTVYNFKEGNGFESIRTKETFDEFFKT